MIDSNDKAAIEGLIAFIESDTRVNGDVALTECRKAFPALQRLLAGETREATSKKRKYGLTAKGKPSVLEQLHMRSDAAYLREAVDRVVRELRESAARIGDAGLIDEAVQYGLFAKQLQHIFRDAK